MPELRRDPIVGRWVIISSERGKRPTDFSGHRTIRDTKFCPFCGGNEKTTPNEVMAYRSNGGPPNSGGWDLRVVPNKFPALQIEGDLGRVGQGMYDRMNGIGAHEVVIETPLHEKTLGSLTIEGIMRVFYAFRDRMLDLQRDKRFRYIVVFKNHGESAGASLEHSHSQLIALPVVPKLVAEEITGSKAHFEFKERCVFCDIIRQELADGVRVVNENRDFLSFCPFASRFPFETWIIPKTHNDSFEETRDDEFRFLAELMKDTLGRISLILNDPPYNMVLHSSPFDTKHTSYYHWHIEIMPKLTNVAGFEWGTGFYINPTLPEEAVQFLRDA